MFKNLKSKIPNKETVAISAAMLSVPASVLFAMYMTKQTINDIKSYEN